MHVSIFIYIVYPILSAKIPNKTPRPYFDTLIIFLHNYNRFFFESHMESKCLILAFAFKFVIHLRYKSMRAYYLPITSILIS